MARPRLSKAKLQRRFRFPRCRKVFPDNPVVFREQLRQAHARGRADPALGYQTSYEPRRSYIESIVHRRAVAGREPDSDAPPVLSPAFDMGDLATVAALDRDRGTTLDFPVDGGRGECDIERDVVVAGCQRLRVGTDLVCDIAAGGRPVGADDAEIDEALPHDMTGGVVDDDRVRHTVLRE